MAILGLIRSIEHNEIVIQFDGLMVTYDYTDMEDIRLAYAVSAHKFQGLRSADYNTAHYSAVEIFYEHGCIVYSGNTGQTSFICGW